MGEFKVNDRVRILDNTNHSVNRVGDVGIITNVDYGDRTAKVRVDDRPTTANWTKFHEMELINKGEEKMSEVVGRPEYIIIVKNTETFKKGGVFKSYDSFWAPESAAEAYHIKPYDTDYIRNEMGTSLLEKGIAVPAVKFNPAFVTLPQNEVLTKMLAAFNKQKSVKKSALVVKKSTKKSGK